MRKTAVNLRKQKQGQDAWNMKQKTSELIAFLAVLATGVILVALGIAPESLMLITTALAGLYLVWRNSSFGEKPPSQE